VTTDVMTDPPVSEPEPEAPASAATANWLYPATVFLSASLLFTLQPLFAKMLTPLMGGTPAVWNTALVFYQGALLAGYLYAHLLATRLAPRQQMIVHGVLVLAGAICLPIGVSGLAGEPDVSAPVVWTLMALGLSVGLPLVAISATAPLIQAWRARIGDSVDPYRLYAASNLGSFIALAAYPFLIEPQMGASLQSLVWAVLYGVLFVALMVAIWLVPKESVAPKAIAERATTWGERARWVAFAAPPSALLVALTTHIVTDVASVPLLWLPPLALFLLTFVIAFSAFGDRIASLAAPVKLMLVFLLAAAMAADIDGGIQGLFIHVGMFFLIVLCCHIELAQQRPEPARLTEFYLWMSLGGVLGGAAAALLAPVVLDTTIEYQIALAACLAVAVWYRADLRWTVPAVILIVAAAFWFEMRADWARWLDIRFPVEGGERPGGATFWIDTLLVWNYELAGGVLCAVAAVAATMASRSAPVVAAIGAVALLLPVLGSDGDGVKFRERSFFGVLEVEDSGVAPDGWRFLSHGTTLHGVKSLDPLRDREPMSYYYRETPIGVLFSEATEAKPTDLHAGVIGLGMGSSSCYAKPGQSWKIFEIDYDVVKAAMDPDLIGFVPRCAPQAEIVMGDARLNMAKQADGWFDILLVDAFSSDAIPTHMVTSEAISMMMSKVAQDGIMIVHISNRYLDLLRIVADAAAVGNFVAMEGWREGNPANPNADTGVRVVVLAHTHERLARYTDTIWRDIVPVDRPRPWTDDHTDVVRAIVENMRIQSLGE
jgi:hypothetical protein